MTHAHATGSDDASTSTQSVIAFPEGLPGFESCRGFVLVSSPELDPLQQLQSVIGPHASFIGIDPKRVLPTYHCTLTRADRERLGAAEYSVLLWLALIAIEPDGAATANMRAPVVINPQTMIGRQVMPYRGLYALRHPLSDIE